MLVAIRHRFTFAITAMLFLTMLLPLNILTETAFAQIKPGQCHPQGKLCPVKVLSPKQKQKPQTDITISSTSGWQQTGLTVQQGDQFTVSYISGTWTVDINNFPYVGPDGYPPDIDKQIYPGCKYDSSLVYAKLLGQIGNGPDFAVGTGGTFTASASGTFSLRINDQDACLGDNGGSIVLTVMGASSALTVTGVYTRDGNGIVKNTFAPGDAIQYVANINNSSGNSMTISLHYQAYGPNNNYIFDSTFTVTIPQGPSGWYTQGTIPTNAPLGTYIVPVSATDQNNPQNQGTGQGQFTVAVPAYDPGNYGGKSGFVTVGSYNEPNKYAYRNYCGPAASRVLISAWTYNVPTLKTLATEEKTNPNSGTYMQNMVGPINSDISQNYYSINYASSQGDFSNMIGRDILDNNHPLITGILTIYGTNHLNGWKHVVAHHIITIYGFDFSSPSAGYIYYYETAGTVAGTTSTGRNSIDYNTFWALVQQNDIQLS